MNTKVDFYFNNLKQWQKEEVELRKLVLECGLTEEFKWRVPCYTNEGSNIVIIHGFKEYCALNFFKGALLKDPKSLLIQQTENVQAGRQMRFSSLEQILKLKSIIKAYIKEAIEIEKSGLKIDYKKVDEYSIPKELEEILNTNSELKNAFNALTPGRQKAYLLFFSAPKQIKTKLSRIEQYTPRILKGKGLNDCVCGLSKRYPNCDGSHKFIKQEK